MNSRQSSIRQKRIAFYGGSFDPVHIGHLAIAETLTEIFNLDEFNFVPAFQAPHKVGKKVSAAVHRYAMLALATNHLRRVKISTIELESPERPFTIETQRKINALYDQQTDIFFVIGADSWLDIKTWREWESVLTETNIIVVTRPDYELTFEHTGDIIRQKIVDLRGRENIEIADEKRIYITDSVNIDVSATEIRQNIKQGNEDWRAQVMPEVADYIEKYRLFI